MTKTRRDHYLTPAVGADTADALDKTVGELARARNLAARDPTAALHLHPSLHEEGRSVAEIAVEAVAATRAYSCSWAEREVADLLAVTTASAWQRWPRAGRGDTDTSQADERGPAQREPSPKP